MFFGNGEFRHGGLCRFGGRVDSVARSAGPLTQRVLCVFRFIVTTGFAVSFAVCLEDVVSAWFAAAASVSLLFHFYQRVTVAA